MHLRTASGSDHVAAVAWPASAGSASGIVGFAVGAALEGPAIREALRAKLPAYMVPAAIHLIETLPLNSNGKVDRKALFADLDAGRFAGREDAA